ncbi:DNA-processing protein DprA [Neptuniibacter sp. 1_MG-2023]|uniref:DNA-processing protein DprA n=1 Tax=Neptuniibacter sp. 1_MG-2023 TaxID=3062662 RepID=UPI0026E12E40|nr:DNA-processing protein DprA [Neptuniibacter sp. 1_MG-2023]MDO6594090.1 DNA-processing protein DprA [Neptuniibacter sp. 1_MG-2023]
MTADPRDWIAVAALPSLGPASIKALWEQGWTPEKLLNASAIEWQRLGLKQKTVDALCEYQCSSQGLVHQAIDTASQWQASFDDAHILPITHSDYPQLLREIYDPPPILFVRGNIQALNLPQIAIVGSRSASASGLKQAYRFALEFAKNGVVVNSGLALGVDAAAHKACIDIEKPTVAVFGTGIDRIYPARNRSLAVDILRNGGAWVSEFFLGSPPIAPHFPKRNRLISGMSVGVLVVEAAPKSGSLITARMAMEHGREVFALPGPLNNPLSRGCHLLIKEGAALVETAQEMVDQLAPLLGCYLNEEFEQDSVNLDSSAQNNLMVELSGAESRVLEQIGYEVCCIDALSVQSGLSIAELSQLLVSMELKGVIEQREGGYIKC